MAMRTEVWERMTRHLTHAGMARAALPSQVRGEAEPTGAQGPSRISRVVASKQLQPAGHCSRPAAAGRQEHSRPRRHASHHHRWLALPVLITAYSYTGRALTGATRVVYMFHIYVIIRACVHNAWTCGQGTAWAARWPRWRRTTCSWSSHSDRISTATPSGRRAQATTRLPQSPAALCRRRGTS